MVSARPGPALLLVLILTAPAPAALTAQVRPEIGLTVATTAGLGGEALEGLEAEMRPGLEAALALTDAWRVAVSHRPDAASLDLAAATGTDLETTMLEVRRSFGRDAPVRPYAGLRVGRASVDYSVSFILLPHTETNSEDAGLLAGPAAGARVLLGPHAAVDVGAALALMDLDPLVVPEGEDPPWSGSFSLSATLVWRP